MKLAIAEKSGAFGASDGVTLETVWLSGAEKKIGRPRFIVCAEAAAVTAVQTAIISPCFHSRKSKIIPTKRLNQ
ncbi:MAG TPA: hypothetical protein VHQ01_02290 [Pyrinomonadaceae bacterium]|nr:hypothetical protein [Pyrinomonadaceae bacterium]